MEKLDTDCVVRSCRGEVIAQAQSEESVVYADIGEHYSFFLRGFNDPSRSLLNDENIDTLSCFSRRPAVLGRRASTDPHHHAEA